MSHDIRTPMNAILGYAELARNHLQEPEKIGEYMDKIHISGVKDALYHQQYSSVFTD
ncbi:MAG: histidine kinase dimerization/phospho-acceptor domain-containing protein [Clostridium fessum]